jgi:hypothetical protein
VRRRAVALPASGSEGVGGEETPSCARPPSDTVGRVHGGDSPPDVAHAARWSWLMPQHVGETLALVSVVSYGLVYVVAAQFYGALGLKPAEVGLDYATLLAQTAVYLGLACVPGVVGYALGFYFAQANLKAATAVTAELDSSARPRGSDSPADPQDEVSEHSPVATRLLASSQTERRARIFGTIIGLVCGALTVFPALLLGAGAASHDVKEGKAPGPVFLGLHLSPWSTAQVARIEWTGASPGPSIPDCAIRLGATAGTEVLYDPQAHVTLRLPQASVATSVDPDATECASGPAR